MWNRRVRARLVQCFWAGVFARLMTVGATLGLVACGGGGGSDDEPSSSSTLRIISTEPGAIYGTFQSFTSTFARDSAGAIYKSYALDKGARGNLDADLDGIVARYDNGRWVQVWSESGSVRPPCLSAFGATMFAVYSDWSLGTLRVVEINSGRVSVHLYPYVFRNAAKTNCIVFRGELIIAGA